MPSADGGAHTRGRGASFGPTQRSNAKSLGFSRFDKGFRLPRPPGRKQERPIAVAQKTGQSSAAQDPLQTMTGTGNVRESCRCRTLPSPQCRMHSRQCRSAHHERPVFRRGDGHCCVHQRPTSRIRRISQHAASFRNAWSNVVTTPTRAVPVAIPHGLTRRSGSRDCHFFQLARNLVYERKRRRRLCRCGENVEAMAEGHKMSDPGRPQATTRLDNDYLTAAQVARWLQVSEKSVYRWATLDPRMPALRIGGVIRFPRERLERWVRIREQGPGTARRTRESARSGTQGPFTPSMGTPRSSITRAVPDANRTDTATPEVVAPR